MANSYVERAPIAGQLTGEPLNSSNAGKTGYFEQIARSYPQGYILKSVTIKMGGSGSYNVLGVLGDITRVINSDINVTEQIVSLSDLDVWIAPREILIVTTSGAVDPYASVVVEDLTTFSAINSTLLTNGGGGGSVDSVFGRVGNVVAVSGDYNSTQITNLSLTPGANVTEALNNTVRYKTADDEAARYALLLNTDVVVGSLVLQKDNNTWWRLVLSNPASPLSWEQHFKTDSTIFLPDGWSGSVYFDDPDIILTINDGINSYEVALGKRLPPLAEDFTLDFEAGEGW